jgi:ubiquinone/menaquinone biosynthesis C-methylase UbiE
MTKDNYRRQVDPNTHYSFATYLGKERWNSIWHQVDELLTAETHSVLEVGVGAGVLAQLLRELGVKYKSVDFDPDLKPDYVASVTQLPLEDDSFDAVGCFQVLEHIHYKDFQTAVGELCRVAKSRVVISIPDASRVWQYHVWIPFLGRRRFLIRRPLDRPVTHVFDGQHHWELNKAGYPLERIMADLKEAGLRHVRTFRVFEHPYHRFFIGQPEQKA